MFRLIKQLFIGRLASITNTSNHSKCVFLNKQQCMIQLTLTNLHLLMNMVKDYVTIHSQLI